MSAPARVHRTIYQGATFRHGFRRMRWPYPVRWECGRFVKACGGEAPETDMTPEDYSGCTAVLQLRRSPHDPNAILELSTDNGGLSLDGPWLRIHMTAQQTRNFEFGTRGAAWEKCIGYVEVTRPSGDVERQYEISFDLSPGGVMRPDP